MARRTPVAAFKIGDRRCNRCGHVGPLRDYVKNAGAKFGRLNRCKPCQAALAKTWYERERKGQGPGRWPERR